MNVAVGFNPRTAGRNDRVASATVESDRVNVQSSLRDEIIVASYRGFKPTPKFTPSLRDTRSSILDQFYLVRRVIPVAEGDK
ncbi:MAG: hypothetical protein WBO10_01175 [Pyrinomonadaceae bacterium]